MAPPTPYVSSASCGHQDVATLQLTADDHLASSINAMHLKD
jgi:hypothetical protein